MDVRPMTGNPKGKTTAQAVANVVQELTDFSSEDRRRIVHASMTLLGEIAALPVPESEIEVQQEGGLPAKARSWMKQYGLTAEQISQVFHFGEERSEERRVGKECR